MQRQYSAEVVSDRANEVIDARISCESNSCSVDLYSNEGGEGRLSAEQVSELRKVFDREQTMLACDAIIALGGPSKDPCYEIVRRLRACIEADAELPAYGEVFSTDESFRDFLSRHQSLEYVMARLNPLYFSKTHVDDVAEHCSAVDFRYRVMRFMEFIRCPLPRADVLSAMGLVR